MMSIFLLKKITTALIAIFFTIAVLLVPMVAAQDINIRSEKVIYDLPFPGLLPDHPLYFLKVARDRVAEFMTRDSMKKAELYLLLADKRAAMALELSAKGKDKLSATTYSKAEKYLEKIPGLIEISKNQGGGPTEGFSQKVKQSVLKHHEVGETLLKELPQGQAAFINESMKLTEQVRKSVQSL